MKRITTILAILAFLYGFFAGTLSLSAGPLHGVAEDWWAFLKQQLNKNIQVTRLERHDQIRDQIRSLRQEKIDEGREERKQLAEQILGSAEESEPLQKIIITQVKYPDLRIIAQDANKNRRELGEQEALLLSRILSVIPSEAISSFKQIIVDYGDLPRRGMAGGSTMFIRNVDSMRRGAKEFIGVAVHELGHLVDIAYHTGNQNADPSSYHDGPNPVYSNDPSVNFYAINWSTDTTQSSSASPLDFTSGYAGSDSFEDFAESFNAFVTQGEAFRLIASKHPALQKKYNFISTLLYDGGDFVSGVNAEQLNQNPRVYDTTVQPISNLVIDSRL